MPARRMTQEPRWRETFQTQVESRVQARYREMDERIDREVPGFVRWLVRPLAHGMRASREAADARKGASGEQAGNLALRWVLPREWILIPDVVLPAGDGAWTQMDHVAVGPTGVWAIETKAWRGVFRGSATSGAGSKEGAGAASRARAARTPTTCV